MNARLRSWLAIACEPAILRQAVLTALIVGTLLTAINHGSELLDGPRSWGLAVPIALTYLVPFAVSLTSSVAATSRHRERS